jgi:hypothetical protein
MARSGGFEVFFTLGQFLEMFGVSMSATSIALTLVFVLSVAAVSWAISRGPIRGRSGIAGRAAVGVAVGVVVGELAAVVLFSGTIDRLLHDRAVASAEVDGARQERTALDTAVEDAGRRRDEALVVARCEFHPSPACPQTHITGVPGAGPETQTATDFLADTQRQLDNAVANRDRLAPALESEITAGEQMKEHGLGARWQAMNDHTFASPGAMLLRLATIAFFALLILLPLILKLWRAKTTEIAHAEVERAELQADTAIAVKRAEVRAAVETLWAEQQLASARLAAEAQTEIDREEQRRRVMQALEAPVQVQSERLSELPAPTPSLPAVVEQPSESTSLIPAIPDVTKAAARWLRPFVPPIVATAIDATTKPLRAARQVFEETEEIHISLKRTHKVSVLSEERGTEPVDPLESPTVSGVPSVERQQMMTASEGHPELHCADGPRRLPPGK